LGHGGAETALTGEDLVEHREGGVDDLTVNCGDGPPPPTDTPVDPTDTPVPTTPRATPMPTTPSPTATTGPTNTPTATVSETKMCGDVDDSGDVNSIDATLVLQYVADLVSTLENLPSADVNYDGEVSSVDAALILQVEAGLLPVGMLDCG